MHWDRVDGHRPTDTDAFAGSVEELSARLREAERRAYEAEAKYDAVLNQLPVAVYVREETSSSC